MSQMFRHEEEAMKAGFAGLVGKKVTRVDARYVDLSFEIEFDDGTVLDVSAELDSYDMGYMEIRFRHES